MTRCIDIVTGTYLGPFAVEPFDAEITVGSVFREDLPGELILGSAFDRHLLGDACRSFLSGLQNDLRISLDLGHRCAGVQATFFYPSGKSGRKIAVGKRIGCKELSCLKRFNF